MRRPLFALTLVVTLAMSCASPPVATTTPSPSPTESPSPSPTPTESPSPTPASPHVFVIVMENASLATALQSAPIERLAAKYVLATNYRSVSSPSLPNYLAMTSGSTWGITDDAYHVLPAGGLGAQLTAAGVSWRAYLEGLTSAGCLSSPYPYALKHNPFAYYGGACPENVVSLDALDGDLAGETPFVIREFAFTNFDFALCDRNAG